MEEEIKKLSSKYVSIIKDIEFSAERLDPNLFINDYIPFAFKLTEEDSHETSYLTSYIWTKCVKKFDKHVEFYLDYWDDLDIIDEDDWEAMSDKEQRDFFDNNYEQKIKYFSTIFKILNINVVDEFVDKIVQKVFTPFVPKMKDKTSTVSYQEF